MSQHMGDESTMQCMIPVVHDNRVMTISEPNLAHATQLL
jgi:hypothetical protein